MRFRILIITIVIAALIGGNAFSQVENNQTLSALNDTSLSHCHDLILAAETAAQQGNSQGAYDGYKTYIESCAYLSNSWETFSDVGEIY